MEVEVDEERRLKTRERREEERVERVEDGRDAKEAVNNLRKSTII